MQAGVVPQIMGIVNVTPDSFSDGGYFLAPEKAVSHGLGLVAEGADILDIGGESTRPGAAPVDSREEIDRILPVIEGLRHCGVMLSVDTRNAATMRAALAAGAGMVNDVSALTHDPDSMAVVAAARVPVCLMHMRGTPGDMQHNPHYDDVVGDVLRFLSQRIEVCLAAGIARADIVIDPGFGFGKTLQHNLLLLHHLDRFAVCGVRVMAGLSRKSFIEKICPGLPASGRLPGSLAGALWAASKGASILRVHDVAATRQALAIFGAVSNPEMHSG